LAPRLHSKFQKGPYILLLQIDEGEKPSEMKMITTCPTLDWNFLEKFPYTHCLLRGTMQGTLNYSIITTFKIALKDKLLDEIRQQIL
jgi:hypothetical protein